MGEISDYIAKANEKLESSKALFNIGHYGDSVSTSYYAMFLVAKALLIKKGHAPKTHK